MWVVYALVVVLLLQVVPAKNLPRQGNYLRYMISATLIEPPGSLSEQHPFNFLMLPSPPHPPVFLPRSHYGPARLPQMPMEVQRRATAASWFKTPLVSISGQVRSQCAYARTLFVHLMGRMPPPFMISRCRVVYCGPDSIEPHRSKWMLNSNLSFHRFS